MSKEVGFQSSNKKKLQGPKDSSVVYTHDFNKLIPGDVAVAVEAAFEKLGWPVEEVSTVHSAGMGREPVEIAFVRYSLDDGVEIPYGTFRTAEIGDVGIKLENSYGGPPFIRVTGILKDKSHKPQWKLLLETVRSIAASTSIFRGRAVKIAKPEDLLVPNILDLSSERSVFFDDDVEKLLNTCVLWPLKNRPKSKRGTLLDGYYGCGKSLFLYNAAKIAHQHGWSVLNTAPGMIAAGIQLAPMLEPTCLIVEDVDAGAHGNRDNLNNLLNSLSSVSSKNHGGLAVLVSTNFLKRIDPALLRPDRIDAVISIPLPNDKTIIRLVEDFADGRLHPDADRGRIASALRGCTPAIISEIIQRSLIDSEINGLPNVHDWQILEHVEQMQRQKELALPEYRKGSVNDTLAESLQEVVGRAAF